MNGRSGLMRAVGLPFKSITKGYFIFCLLLSLIFPAGLSSAGESAVQIIEPFISIEFDTLEGFEPVHFPKIPVHTEYSIMSEQGDSFLVAFANSSASALVYTHEFDVYEYPVVSWRWRVSNVYKNGHAGIKSGDDFPARLYVMFAYDPSEAPIGQRMVYGALKVIYGEYPPHSTLNYVWANRPHDNRYITSPYTSRSILFIMEEGMSGKPQAWAYEIVNVVNDYRAAFGKSPPRMAQIAVMSDSDNTGERATTHFDSITVGPAP
ncbi:MAG: DUF3047 domain-containing protein [Thermodesulfovibrionales bacterium]|nr:DUF3047 domain-containing protein [Thermodesulfovibrionales bacterium]